MGNSIAMNNIILSPIPLTEMENIIKAAVKSALEKYLTSLPQLNTNTLKDRIFIKEVMELTNLSKNTIYSLSSKKAIPVFRPEGTKQLMFSRKSIIEWMEQGRPASSEKKAHVEQKKEELIKGRKDSKQKHKSGYIFRQANIKKKTDGKKGSFNE